MAELKYLAHINLNQNQLQNAAMQILSSDPSGFEGHVYYNSSSNVLKYHNGSAYVALGTATGDIDGVTAGDGLTGGGTSGTVTVNVVGGDGITANANDVAITAAQTTITSVFNSSLKVGYGDSHANIDFSTDNAIIFDIDGTQQIKLQDGALVPITDNDIDLGTSSLEFKNAYFDGTVTSDAFAGPLTGDVTGNADTATTLATARTIGGVSFDGSANINLPGVNTSGNQNTSGTAAVATTVTVTDNESTNEENAIIFAAGGDVDGGNLGMESDGDLTYNPSTGTVSATIFKGNIDAVDGDFDGTLEADAITIGGTNLLSEGMEFTGNTVFSGNPSFSGTPSVSGTLSVAGNIVHTGDTNCLIGFTTDAIKFQTGGTSRANVSDSGFQIGSGARVTTIENNDSLGTSDTKLATQGNVKAYVDARTGTNITSLGTIAQDTVVFSSANANDPEVQIKNTTNDASGARLTFIKDKGAAGADGDDIGVITFTADDAAQTLTDYGKLLVEVGEADDSDEAGKMSLQVASSDGTTTGLTSGLVLTGHKTSDYVDVTLGSGSSSTVTIPGNLTVSGTTTTVNSTTVNLNDHNIVLDSGNSTSAVVNGAGITIEGGSGSDATFTYNTTGPKFELKLGSSYEDLQVDQLIAASLDISGNVDVDGTLETDALSINGTTVTSTGAELNILDGVTSTAAEINLLDGSEGGTITNNKAVIYDGNGVVNATTLQIAGTAITATAAEINKLDGVTASTDELNIIDGVTATTAEINLIDGGTSRGTTAVANGDGFLHNDGGTMRMTNVSKLADLFAGTNISASSSVLSVADAADDTKGVVELATTAEALAGSDTARAVTPAGLAARSFKATIGDGSDLDIAITHNLGTRDVIVQCYDASSYETVIVEAVRTDANNVTINTNQAITTNDLIVLITKID
jgi:uncharacterized protein YaiE (UPF0345 family)